MLGQTSPWKSWLRPFGYSCRHFDRSDTLLDAVLDDYEITKHHALFLSSLLWLGCRCYFRRLLLPFAPIEKSGLPRGFLSLKEFRKSARKKLMGFLPDKERMVSRWGWPRYGLSQILIMPCSQCLLSSLTSHALWKTLKKENFWSNKM